MIHHLSFPHGSSVNNFIPEEFSTLKYATVDDAIKMIKTLGVGCVLAKTDVRSAFRIVPVHPSDYHLLGFHWQNEWYHENLSVSPWVVQVLAKYLNYLVQGLNGLHEIN